MMSCKQATRLISESQDRQLGMRERIFLKIHTLMCSACQNFGQHMHTLRQAMRSFAEGANETRLKND